MCRLCVPRICVSSEFTEERKKLESGGISVYISRCVDKACCKSARHWSTAAAVATAQTGVASATAIGDI